MCVAAVAAIPGYQNHAQLLISALAQENSENSVSTSSIYACIFDFLSVKRYAIMSYECAAKHWLKMSGIGQATMCKTIGFHWLCVFPETSHLCSERARVCLVVFLTDFFTTQSEFNLHATRS